MMDDRPQLIVRPYRPSDRSDVRMLAAADEQERPQLLAKYPRLGDYRADGLTHYYDLEPESCFVAEEQGGFIGSLLGTVDVAVAERREGTYTRDLRWKHLVLGRYGMPLWLIPVIRTERAVRASTPPRIDQRKYPAELHIGVKRGWQRQGVGTALMNAFEDYLRSRSVPGYHLSASSYHHQGVQFYRKLGLEELGQFNWRLHDGYRWRDVCEHVFARQLTAEAR